MAPLTLKEKYDDLVRCADQPLSSYSRLSNEDLEDVTSKTWPFIIQSITYTPLSLEKNDSMMSASLSTGEVHIKLERRLKIQFQLYSEAAKRYQQIFPNRKPIKRIRDHTNTYMIDNESLSIEPTSTFSLESASNMDIPDFYVFCAPESSNKRQGRKYGQLSSTAAVKQRQIDYDRVIKYLKTVEQTSPYKMLVFNQALKECCRCGNYYLLQNLCLAVDTSIESIYFDNNDTILHESIKLNNKQLTSELIRYRFNINENGELGTPLVTAIHYNILWAVNMLLNHNADLTKRHIDWSYWTLYEYCIQFDKIDIKSIIDKHIKSLIQKRKFTIIRKLINDGWNLYLTKKRH